MESVDFQITKTMQSLSTAQEMRNQTQLVMQPYSNWEAYLSPAPLSIAIMGELAVLASQTDFSINKNPPTNGYKHIRYPESFRACLMQVCNSGWWAFAVAHKNMDQIRLHTMAVPNYMKNAVKILFQGNNPVIKTHLSDQLENIRTIADDCHTLAIATEKCFGEVINIIQELLEACLNAKTFYGQEVEEIKKKLEENKMKKASAEETKKRLEKAVKNLDDQMKEAQETYKQAMKSLPGGWEMMAMDLVGAVTEGVTGLFHGISTLATQPGNLFCKAATTISDIKHQIRGEHYAADGVDEIIIYSKSVEIMTCTEIIQQFVHGDMIDWMNLYDQQNNATKTDFPAIQFKRIKEHLEQLTDCEPNLRAQCICNAGINICQELAKYAPAGTCDATTTKQLIKKIELLIESARKFDSKSKAVTKAPPMIPKPPMMFKQESQSVKKSASEKASENARFRIEQSHAQLNKSTEVYEKNVENMEMNQKELTNILIEMRKCEYKEIDFKTTTEMLIKGMDAMGRVKEQWEKMVRFFFMVSNIVKTSLTRTLEDFVSSSEKLQTVSYDNKLFSKDLLYNQVFEATNYASLVHMISATYTDVSNKYLMDRVSALGKLLTLDKESPGFPQEVDQLRNKCDEAEKAILQLVRRNKVEFERKSKSRLDKINKELLAILPAAAPEVIKSIKATVVEEFTEEDKAQYT